MVREWNLQMQRQVSSDVVLSVNYAGNAPLASPIPTPGPTPTMSMAFFLAFRAFRRTFRSPTMEQ